LAHPQRTATSGTHYDFRTWDIRQLSDAIDREFTLRWPVTPRSSQPSPPSMLSSGRNPADAGRPTLYGSSPQALEFYQAGEQGLARPEDALCPHPWPLLGAADEFLRWQPDTADTNSATLKRSGVPGPNALTRPIPDPLFLSADLDRLLRLCHRRGPGPRRALPLRAPAPRRNLAVR
jgi:hypothetical protein